MISSVSGGREKVACPGPSQPAQSGASQGAGDSASGAAGQSTSGGGGSKSAKRKYVDSSPAANAHSESEASLDAGRTEAQDDDNMSEASDASVPVGRSLWDVAASHDHQLSHKPGLPIHCTQCMMPKRNVSAELLVVSRRLPDVLETA